MQSIRLTIAKADLLTALGVLGVTRRRRGVGIIPVWLSFDAASQELRISEDHGKVVASVPANGEWPAAGATVNLFMLRRGAASCGEAIELHATEDAIILLTPRGHVRLDFIAFGNEPRHLPKPDMHSDLPLFRWAQPLDEDPLRMINRIARMSEARDRFRRERAKRRR